MSLPTHTTNITKTIPSYLYFQYQNDPDLPALIDSYNVITQEYVDWFNDINLPIYTNLNGALLDWVGQGLYGLIRPSISSTTISNVIGQIASVKHHGPSGPTPNIAPGISTTQIFSTSTVIDTPDDIYKRILTWWFYKGDGFDFSIPWLKRRIARFLYGIDGKDVMVPFTPTISVQFTETTPLPTCNITIESTPDTVDTYFEAAIQSGVLCTPFRFAFDVTINP